MVKHRVLIVAHYFPPLGGAGVQRTVKFVKYLPEFGWQPYVLASRGGKFYVHDASLATDLPPGLSVTRAFAIEPALPSARLNRLIRPLLPWIMVPDNQVSWLPGAVRLGKQIIAREGIDLIFTTSAPYTSHLIGRRLKRATGLPWVADFRDEWTLNPNLVFPSSAYRRLHERWEQATLRAADRVISVSPSITSDFAALVPDQPCTKFATIANGYDSADWNGLKSARQDGVFTVTYTGSLYGIATAVPFLDALEQFLAENPAARRGILVRFVGNTGIQPEIKRRKLEDIVVVEGYLQHAQTIERQMAASVLVLILSTHRGPGALSGKIFEYLASSRPILAMVPPEGEAAQLIRHAGAGVVVAPEDTPAIVGALGTLYSEWTAGRLNYTANEEIIRQYDRRVLAGRLAGYFDELVGRAKP